MTNKELEAKVINAQSAVAKREAVLAKHREQLAKLIAKGADQYDIRYKEDDIKTATGKLEDARRILKNWQDKLGAQISRDDVTEGDILTLVMLLNKHIKRANADCETSMGTMYLSRRIDLKRKTNGTLISCFLYVNSHYFERRECISFNADGWIGFAGWADQGNTNPILRAFLEWCDLLHQEMTA